MKRPPQPGQEPFSRKTATESRTCLTSRPDAAVEAELAADDHHERLTNSPDRYGRIHRSLPIRCSHRQAAHLMWKSPSIARAIWSVEWIDHRDFLSQLSLTPAA